MSPQPKDLCPDWFPTYNDVRPGLAPHSQYGQGPDQYWKYISPPDLCMDKQPHQDPVIGRDSVQVTSVQPQQSFVTKVSYRDFIFLPFDRKFVVLISNCATGL